MSLTRDLADDRKPFAFVAFTCSSSAMSASFSSWVKPAYSTLSSAFWTKSCSTSLPFFRTLEHTSVCVWTEKGGHTSVLVLIVLLVLELLPAERVPSIFSATRLHGYLWAHVKVGLDTPNTFGVSFGNILDLLLNGGIHILNGALIFLRCILPRCSECGAYFLAHLDVGSRPSARWIYCRRWNRSLEETALRHGG